MNVLNLQLAQFNVYSGVNLHPHFTALQERACMLSQMCCSVATVSEKRRVSRWQQTSHFPQFLQGMKNEEGFTQAGKFKRQLPDLLPCSATPPALHLESGPAMEKTEQIISWLVSESLLKKRWNMLFVNRA